MCVGYVLKDRGTEFVGLFLWSSFFLLAEAQLVGGQISPPRRLKC